MIVVTSLDFSGLSHLVAASFSEDTFGVVQTTLPSILSSLLSLQEVSTERRERERERELVVMFLVH